MLLLTCGIVLAENVITWWFSETVSIGFDVLLLLVLLIVVWIEHLDAPELGFGLRGTGVSLMAAALMSLHVLTIVFLLAVARPVTFQDVEAPGSTAGLVGTLARIVFVTAFVEEITFRAVLFALWRRVVPLGGEGWRRVLRWLAPSLVTGVAFGLWHIGPTRDTLLELHRSLTWGPFLAAVAAMTAVGITVFGLLRQLTGGIAGGVLLHAVTNGSVVAAGFVISQGLITH